jgi:hypothetical protein
MTIIDSSIEYDYCCGESNFNEDVIAHNPANDSLLAVTEEDFYYVIEGGESKYVSIAEALAWLSREPDSIEVICQSRLDDLKSEED